MIVYEFVCSTCQVFERFEDPYDALRAMRAHACEGQTCPDCGHSVSTLVDQGDDSPAVCITCDLLGAPA